MLRGAGEAISQAVRTVEELGVELGVLRDSRDTIVEYTHPSASKEAALRYLLERLQVSPASVKVFGDGYNDAAMMRIAGRSIAMSNSPAEVKAVANEVTLSNDEEGVGYALRKHFSARDHWFSLSGE